MCISDISISNVFPMNESFFVESSPESAQYTNNQFLKIWHDEIQHTFYYSMEEGFVELVKEVVSGNLCNFLVSPKSH